MEFFARYRILNRHDVSYFFCRDCQFLRTEKPYWLEEAYSQAIAATDTGIVLRNLKIARQLTCILPLLFDAKAKFVDMAGGTGLLTRLMRDNGFDFYWEDLYCANVLAAGFEAPRGAAGFDAVTAFEAVEHMERPYEFIEQCMRRSSGGTFIFATELFEPPAPKAGWWYLSTATGQHISFFSALALQRIAQRLGVSFLSHRGLHMFTRLPITARAYRKALNGESSGRFEKVMKKRRGFTDVDHELMTRRLIGVDENSSGVASTSGDIPADGWLARTTKRWKSSLNKRLRRLDRFRPRV